MTKINEALGFLLVSLGFFFIGWHTVAAICAFYGAANCWNWNLHLSTETKVSKP